MKTLEAVELLSSVEAATRELQHTLNAWEAAEKTDPAVIAALCHLVPRLDERIREMRSFRDAVRDYLKK